MARPFLRDTRRGILGGVAAGLGSYFDVDPLLVRLGLVFLVFLNGLGLLFYVICWVLVPPAEPEHAAAVPVQQVATGVRAAGEQVASGLRGASERAGGARALAGAFLVLLGTLLLMEQLDWLGWPRWARLETLWPLAIVAAGVGILMRAGERRAT
jgi:phage shock protein PspC (stress-responsive transcriptional regulator)